MEWNRITGLKKVCYKMTETCLNADVKEKL